MRRVLSFAAATLLFGGAVFAQSASTPSDDAALTRDFDAAIHPDELRDWMKIMASEPNHVGSPHDKANAEFELAKFKEWAGTRISKSSRCCTDPGQRNAGTGDAQTVHRDLAGEADPGDSSATATDYALPAISPIRAMATSKRRWSTPTTACRTLQDAGAHGRQREGQDRCRTSYGWREQARFVWIALAELLSRGVRRFILAKDWAEHLQPMSATAGG